MDLSVERVDVWAAPIEDQPGGLAKVLNGLREAGADLDFVLARRSPDRPGWGVVFVTPLKGDRQTEAASKVGFNITSSVHSVRIEGPNKPGLAADVADKLGAEGINLRGLSAGVVGARFIMYLGLDSADDAARAVAVLESL